MTDITCKQCDSIMELQDFSKPNLNNKIYAPDTSSRVSATIISSIDAGTSVFSGEEMFHENKKRKTINVLIYRCPKCNHEEQIVQE